MKEQIRTNLEKRLQTTVADLEREKTKDIAQMQKKVEALKHQIDMQNQQYEEALRRAENDKQQALLLGEYIKMLVFNSMIIRLKFS